MDTVSLWHICMLAKYVAGISLGLCACVYIRKISKGFALCEEVACHWQDTGGSPPRLTTLTAPGCTDKEQLLLGLRCKESPRCPQVHLKADFLTVYCLALPSLLISLAVVSRRLRERARGGGGTDGKERLLSISTPRQHLLSRSERLFSLTCHAWPTPTSRSFWPISPHSLDRFQPQRGSWHKNHTDMLRLRSCLDFSPVINKKKKRPQILSMPITMIAMSYGNICKCIQLLFILDK